jgi:hypothetical protein
MKKSPKHKQVRFYLYLTKPQSDLVSRLREAGLSVSTIGRQSIRKCNSVPLVTEEEIPRSERCNLYLSSEDASLLEQVANRDGCSKAMALRRLVTTYLANNAAAIDALF